MRIAVLADIHGNLVALEAVLADLERREVDLVVDLGDCVSGPLWPAETLRRLTELRPLTVRGNHDRQLASLAPERLGASDRFAHERLSEEERDRLGALRTTWMVAPGILACHGIPGSDEQYLIEEIEGGRLVRARPEAIAARLGVVEAEIVLCGHSHRPDMVRLPNGILVVNPGSVGCPAYDDPSEPAHISEAGTPHARYAVIDTTPASGITVAHYAVAYAHEHAARRAEANGRLEWAHALRTGSMPKD